MPNFGMLLIFIGGCMLGGSLTSAYYKDHLDGVAVVYGELFNDVNDKWGVCLQALAREKGIELKDL